MMLKYAHISLVLTQSLQPYTDIQHSKAFSSWKIVLYHDFDLLGLGRLDLDLLDINQTRNRTHRYLREMNKQIYKDAVALSNLNCLNSIQFVYDRKTQILPYQELALIRSNLNPFRMVRAWEADYASDSKMNKLIENEVPKFIQVHLNEITSYLPVIDLIQIHKDVISFANRFLGAVYRSHWRVHKSGRTHREVQDGCCKHCHSNLNWSPRFSVQLQIQPLQSFIDILDRLNYNIKMWKTDIALKVVHDLCQ